MSKSLKVNFHTHTTYCDGADTPEENVICALEKKIDILGFSPHSSFPHPYQNCNMNPDDFENYCREIKNLKEKYSGQVQVKLGFEADFIPGFSKPDFDAYKNFSPDFLIGSVHFLHNGESKIEDMLAVDNTPQILNEGLKRLYGGDEKKLVSHYFSAERQMLCECSFSIIAHADLIRKFNGTMRFFDETADWYKKELKATADAIQKAGVIAEVNTGAVSRGYLKTPYPSEYFLELLFERKVPVIISSDAHKKENLDSGYENALALVKKTGWRELSYPDGGAIRQFKV